VGSNPTRGMDVCVYSVFVFCAYVAALRGADPSSKESYRLSVRLRTEVKQSVSRMLYAPNESNRNKDGWMNGWMDSLHQASSEPQNVYTRGCLGQQESDP
jgi:hypothetical protein